VIFTSELRESMVSAKSFKSVSLEYGIKWAESEMNKDLPEIKSWEFKPVEDEGSIRFLSRDDLEKRTFSAELKSKFPVYLFLELIAFNTGTVFTVDGRVVTFQKQVSE
jgi:hypothetical protein